jgi:prepilin-type N-terminal cleavage/methylation domain-containing protein
MENQKGFTVIELLVCVIVVGIAGSVLLGLFLTPKTIATQSASSYIQQAKAAGVDDFKLLDCMSADNDRDGKISCTVINQKTNARQLLLCESTAWAKFMGGSCADPKPFTINNQNQNQ